MALTYESIRDRGALTGLCSCCEKYKMINSYLCAEHQVKWHEATLDKHQTKTFVQWCNDQLPPDPICGECEGLGKNNDYLCETCRYNRNRSI